MCQCRSKHEWQPILSVHSSDTLVGVSDKIRKEEMTQSFVNGWVQTGTNHNQSPWTWSSALFGLFGCTSFSSHILSLISFLCNVRLIANSGKHVVFGRVIMGMDVVRTIEGVGSKSGTTLKKVAIADSGELE